MFFASYIQIVHIPLEINTHLGIERTNEMIKYPLKCFNLVFRVFLFFPWIDIPLKRQNKKQDDPIRDRTILCSHPETRAGFRGFNQS